MFLAQLQPTGRRSTRIRLERVAALFGATIGSFRWTELRYAHVVAVRAYLQEQGKSASTINMTLSALRQVARSALNSGQIEPEQYLRIREVRGVRASLLPAGRALARTELSALLDECAGDETPAGARDALLIGLLALGLRRAECAGLTVADATTHRGRLTVRGKGNKERDVPLDAGGAGALRRWLEARGEQPGALLCRVAKGGRITGGGGHLSGQAIYDALRRRARQAGLAHVSPHDLRRTFVSELLARGEGMDTVRELCGHSSIQTTSRYNRLGDEVKRLAIETLSLPWSKPRPKRRPRRARRGKRKRRS